MSSPVLQKVLSFILLIVLGYLLKARFKDQVALKALRTIILSVALPATVFLSTLDVEVKFDLLIFPAYALIVNICLLIVGYLLVHFKLIKLEVTKQRIFTILFPSLAPGLTIYPFLEQFNGRDSLAWAAISDVGNKLFVLFGLLFLAYTWYQKSVQNCDRAEPSQSQNVELKTSQSQNLVLTLLCEPINAALIIALILAKIGFSSTNLPLAVLDSIDKISAITTPLILIFIGLSLKSKSIDIKQILLVLAIRSGIGFILSRSAVFFLHPSSPDIIMLLVALPQASCSLWPLLHAFQINEHKAVKHTFFDTEFGANFLALSFPFSCSVLLFVFSSSNWFFSWTQTDTQTYLSTIAIAALICAFLCLVLALLNLNIKAFLKKLKFNKKPKQSNNIEIARSPVTIRTLTPASIHLSDLPPNVQKQLLILITQSVGTFAPLLIERGIRLSMTCQEFLDWLSYYIPSRSPVWKRIESLLLATAPSSDIANEVHTIKPIRLKRSVPLELNPDFVATCISSLENAIGPIALLLTQRTIARNPSISQSQLIRDLAKNIPNPQLAQQFLSRFFLNS